MDWRVNTHYGVMNGHMTHRSL